ncbi:pyridoxal phosphate-dependent aminotransferase [Ralstonia pseudosolanacearum]|uniref:pyridoxal phosphate-dependent aminotransferase n=1 Tax=Ralstonia pseudosolanacearum TaxID=1310165 RepID=UPI0026758634|nr:pyridoxal phosphate-dependent aminotransferase [Ralstonia pseudosolanacearum]MDO3522431.1 pyridoxal phosphate-dependent aminotransferase [Ralstonia pseudosolanacearum]MDO3546136.1 pyridoxal phosphate-dependent aminotransferase [Ralstonia pseudosolanacearum]MDO3553116.1 pyridoxal phosphate-dependent aminotransferase [Ralstonia pseudosolanacearum]MDO3568467.1 pyridoxal phosphate-dependent aminotransferase [Ralstonia pseudosolanacearum]MDO3583656.1 pyridoxal phosphate-dependent aminotransferas
MHAMLSSKVSTLAPSPIQLMAARTREAREAGRDVVDLTLGEPDFATPEHICEAARRAIADGLTKYTPISGLARLREAVARKFRDENGIECTAAETLVGCGGKQVIYQAFVATIDPGDEVLIPAPYWSSYADIVTLCGGIVKPLPTAPESGYALQPQTLAEGISARTKWLVLNAPSNPSGTAYTAAQLEAFAEVLRRSGNPRLLILADDIYEHIVFDGLRFASFAAVAPDLRHRTLTVNGVSKAYAMTGWRVGYGCGPKPLIDAMANVQMQVNSHTVSISQAAAIAALEGPQDELARRRAIFEQRRDSLLSRLGGIAGLRTPRPQGAFYLFPDAQAFIGRRTPEGCAIDDDQALAAYLLDSGVAVVPGSGFGMPGCLRLSYATSEARLELAATRLAGALRRLGD